MRPIEFNLSLCWSYRFRLAFQLQLLGIELQTVKWFLYISDLTFSIHFFAKRTLGTHKLLDNFVKPVHELGSVWHLILQVKITYFFVNLWSIIKVMIFFFISASISSYVSQGAGASPLETALLESAKKTAYSTFFFIEHCCYMRSDPFWARLSLDQ